MTYSAVPRVDPATMRLHPDIEGTLAAQVVTPTIAGGALGVVTHIGAKTKAAILTTLAAAEALGKGIIVQFPSGMYDVGSGLSLAGYSCQIRGQGAHMQNTTTPTGTVFYASSQAGPVLDFKGWVYPDQFSGKVRHGDFAVRGSGVADPTKANIGLRIDFIMSATFSDITIMGTGGPCMKITCDTPGYACYLSDFERITLRTPVSAKTNDVPYFHAIEANGNRFYGIGLISRSSSADVGVSGAVVVEGSATYPSHDNKFDAWWFENLHLPQDGCLVSISANTNIIDAFQFFDLKRESGATNTTHYRLLPTLTGDAGGNEIRGLIPGDNNAVGLVPNSGVDIRQSGNSVVGVKGYRGGNVIITSGVERSYVHLTGAQGNSSTAGVVDNSGMATNTIVDRPAGTYKFAAGAANPVLDIGGGVTIRAGSGDPNGVWAANPGSLFLRTDGASGTTIYVKDIGTNSSGWVPRTADSYSAANISSNFAVNCASTHAWNLTLQGSYTMTGFSNGRVGQTQILILTQDATGGRTVTWPASIKWASGTPPVLSTAPGASDTFQFVFCNDGFWREIQRPVTTSAVDVQVFTSGGTWTKPPGCTWVEPTVISGGAGGGAGRRGAAGTIRAGGGGGGGGSVAGRRIPASACGSTETVTVGAGGAGGAAQTANDSNGAGGSAGGLSSFGAHAKAFSPTAGGGGTNAAGTAGAGAAGGFAGGNAGAASATGGAGGNASTANGSAGGGGAGGGVTSADVASAGGAGGTAASTGRAASTGAAVDASGSAPTDSPTNSGEPGGGGSGGGGSITGPGGAGGNGALYGGGGGGGGASLNGNNSGKGGDGAAGIVVVISA